MQALTAPLRSALRRQTTTVYTRWSRDFLRLAGAAIWTKLAAASPTAHMSSCNRRARRERDVDMQQSAMDGVADSTEGEPGAIERPVRMMKSDPTRVVHVLRGESYRSAARRGGTVMGKRKFGLKVRTRLYVHVYVLR